MTEAQPKEFYVGERKDLDVPQKPKTENRTIFTHQNEGEVHNPIWWLASWPKSGSTWLRMFLTAYATHGRVDINAPGVVTSDQTPSFYQLTTSKPLHLISDCELMHIRPAMLQNLITLYPRRPLYVKTHHQFAEVDYIPTIPPMLTMGATYLIRDPRDVAVSYSHHMGVEIDKAIDMMTDPVHRNGDLPILYVVGRWDDHVQSWMEAPERANVKVGIVKYEDILERPQLKFEGILKHMGVPVIPSHAYYAMGACSFKSLRAQEDESDFREKTKHQDKFFRRGEAGGWKDDLSKDQVKRIEKEFGPTMEKFGYV